MPSNNDRLVQLNHVSFFNEASMTFVPCGSITFSLSSGVITKVNPSSTCCGLSLVKSDNCDQQMSDAGVVTLDARGYLLLPGLINSGITLSQNGMEVQKLLNALRTEDEHWIEALSLSLSQGITTAVVKSATPFAAFSLSKSPVAPSLIFKNSKNPLPKTSSTLLQTGCILTSPPTPWPYLHAAASQAVETTPKQDLEQALLDILKSATVDAAKQLVQETGDSKLSRGVISAGARADFLFVRLPGSILSNIKHVDSDEQQGDIEGGVTATQVLLSLFLSPPGTGLSKIDAVFIGGTPTFSMPGTPFAHLWTSVTLSTYYTPSNAAGSTQLQTTGADTETGFDSIEDAIEEIKRGGFVIAVDNEDRENEGDLIIAAEDATPEKMAFMIRYTSGVICVCMTPSRLEELELPLMVQKNEDTFKTAYTISVDAKHVTTTGISSEDRSSTIKALANPSTTAGDFQRPGHVFPLRAQPGGVLRRVGHTEASVDLAKLAGKQPCAAICEVVLDEGGMARRDDLMVMAKKWGMKIITISDLVKYRMRHGLGLDW